MLLYCTFVLFPSVSRLDLKPSFSSPKRLQDAEGCWRPFEWKDIEYIEGWIVTLNWFRLGCCKPKMPVINGDERCCFPAHLPHFPQSKEWASWLQKNQCPILQSQAKCELEGIIVLTRNRDLSHFAWDLNISSCPGKPVPKISSWLGAPKSPLRWHGQMDLLFSRETARRVWGKFSGARWRPVE